MKRLALLLAAFALGTAALADTFFSQSQSTSTTVACSSLTATSGVSLGQANGYSFVVSADRPDAGVQTLYASGTMKCCTYRPVDAGTVFRWMPCPTGLDMAMSTCVTLTRDCPSDEYEPLVGFGRVAYVPSALLVDGGTTVTTTITVRRAQ